VGTFNAEVERQLRVVFAVGEKLLEHEARLDVVVVLVLAGVFFDLAADFAVEDLPNWYAGIDLKELELLPPFLLARRCHKPKFRYQSLLSSSSKMMEFGSMDLS